MADLEFQSFHNQKVTAVGSVRDDEGGTTYEFSHGSDKVNLLSMETNAESNSKENRNFWSFDYYRQFFDVDTDEVVGRVIYSMIPQIRGNFIVQHIRPIPDLYGPFWICITLIFTTAICGNLAKYISSAGDSVNNHFESDFRLVTGSATVIFCYVTLVPFGLYTLLWYRRANELQYTYLEILSAYGYSLAIFVPVSVLWVIDVELFRWALIAIAVVLSGLVLVFSIWPAVKKEKEMVSVSVIIVILALHSFLAVGYKEYYFDFSTNENSFVSKQLENMPGGLESASLNENPNSVSTGNENGIARSVTTQKIGEKVSNEATQEKKSTSK